MIGLFVPLCLIWMPAYGIAAFCHVLLVELDIIDIAFFLGLCLNSVIVLMQLPKWVLR